MLKYSIKFSVKNNEEDTPTPLRMRVSYNAMRIELYPRIVINPSKWDSKKERIKGNAVLNNQISRLENIVIDIFQEYELAHKRYPSKTELKDEFAIRTLRAQKTETKLKFYELMDIYIEEKRDVKLWSVGSIKKYNKLRNHLYYFDQDLELESVTKDTFRKLFEYFKEGPKSSKGKSKDAHRNTTIKREMNDYKRILKWGYEQGYYTGNAHNEFEQVYKGTNDKLSDLVYLEWEELMELLYYDFSKKENLGRVRDVFCFCCFTSLRFSDVKKLRKSDIRNGKIFVTTTKTTDPIVIELNNFAKDILKKYEGVEISGDLALPVISMTKTNLYLKKIGELLNFDTIVKEIYFVGNERKEQEHFKKDVLSTHAARRTFVINALKLGIPSEVIIKWTGHKDFENLKPYVKIVDELKEKEMDKFNLAPTFTPRKNET